MDNKGSVEIRGLSKRFGPTVAASNISVEIPSGSFFSLLGPSGCGKTTLLRMIGGFEEPDSGEILIGGKDVTRTRPQDRPTAMVFQNYALFPSMTVGGNVEYGLKVRKIRKSERRSRVETALKTVGLDKEHGRRVTELSGGQQQRVALARAIVVEPDVLLFDEPLSNLDLALRESTRRELKALQKEVGITSIYVTHDQHEAMAMSDTIAVMDAGRILQVGSPKELYAAPATQFVAQFLGSANVVHDNTAVKLLTGVDLPTDDAVLVVRPEHLSFSTHGLPVRITARDYHGYFEEIFLESDVQNLTMRWRDGETVDSGFAIATNWLFLDSES